MEVPNQKVEWRYSMRDSGGQFVMTVGILMTHRYLVLHKDVDELLRLTEGGGVVERRKERGYCCN